MFIKAEPRMGDIEIKMSGEKTKKNILIDINAVSNF